MERNERVLAMVGDHCDLEWRLGVVSPSSQVRGVYFRSVAAAIAQLGYGDAYEALCEPGRRSPLKFYSTADYLVCLAGAGALAKSPEEVHAGIRLVSRLHARAFSESLLGRALLKLLSPDPKRLLLQGGAARRQTSTPGYWELEFPDERTAVVKMFEEYHWIESSMVGAAEGTFDMIGLEVSVECTLDSPFEGTHVLRW